MLRDRPVKTWLSGGRPVPVVAPAYVSPAATTGNGLWLLLRAFASGCTAMTGVEAVSNGVRRFAEPAVAQRAPHADGDHRASS